MEKALELGVKVVTEEEFMKILKERGGFLLTRPPRL